MQAEQPYMPLNISPTAERSIAAVSVVAIIAGSGVIAYFDPSKINFLPVCPLFALTGFACPGCGLTRGFHALFHGDILTAVDFNALIPFWVLVLVYVFVSLVLLAVRGRGLPMWLASPKFLGAFVILLLLFGVVRNIPAYPFTFLFP